MAIKLMHIINTKHSPGHRKFWKWPLVLVVRANSSGISLTVEGMFTRRSAVRIRVCMLYRSFSWISINNVIRKTKHNVGVPVTLYLHWILVNPFQRVRLLDGEDSELWTLLKNQMRYSEKHLLWLFYVSGLVSQNWGKTPQNDNKFQL